MAKSSYGRSIEDSITPDFVSRDDAKKTLKNRELAATSPLSSEIEKTAKTREKSPKSFYTGSGSKKSDQTKKKGKFKKKIPALILTVFLGVAGIGVLSTNSLLGPHLSALYTESTDTQYPSGVLREKSLKITPKYGRSAGFYDKAADQTYRKLGLSRNIFKDYKETGDTDADTKNYDDTRKAVFDGETDSNVNTAEDRTVTDENGETRTERTATGEDVETRNVAGETSTAKARNYIANISSKVGNVGNAGCAVLKIGSMVATAVSGYELYSAIHYAMNNMESISKMMAGEGSESGINETLNFFAEPKTTTVTDPDTGEEITMTGSPLQAEGNREILGGVTPNQKNSNLFSLERLFKATIGAGALTGATFKSCNMVRATTAIISIAALATPGGGLVRSVVGLLLDTAIAAGAEIAISGVLGFMIPHIAQALFSNAFESYTGIPAGEISVRGIAGANMRIGRSGSGQSPSSAEAILAYNNANEEVLAEEAKKDRENRSPFDITSKNTFLGSLARKFMVLNYQSSLSGVFNTFSNIAKNSLPRTLASGENENYLTTFGENCPNLEEIGAKGDIYCNPITTTDLSTVDLIAKNDVEYLAAITSTDAPTENLTAEDKTYISIIQPNLETTAEGKERIKNNSELAKYVKYCTERDSPFGVQDANIASDLETSLGVVGDNLPFIGDIVDIVNSIEAEGGSGWVNGQLCVNSSKNDRWDTEMKYYQRYIEDNRILARETGSEDVVSIFKEEYYKEHPLDNSRAGYLARVSGLSKSDAEETLAYIDYFNFLKNYDPSIAYNFNNNKNNEKIYFNLDNNVSNIYIINESYYYEKRKLEVVA